MRNGLTAILLIFVITFKTGIDFLNIINLSLLNRKERCTSVKSICKDCNDNFVTTFQGRVMTYEGLKDSTARQLHLHIRPPVFLTSNHCTEQKSKLEVKANNKL